MSVTTSIASKAPVRRRRLLLFVAVLVGIFFFFGVPWELPPALKDVGLDALSRASIAKLTKMKTEPPVDVDEIFGLLHLVVGNADNDHALSQAEMLDPTKPIELSIYAGGNKKLNWNKEVLRLNEKFPVVVFSKSYCPYSQRAKKLLESYDIHPEPKVVEVDLRDDSDIIKAILTRLTAHSTFPNVLIKGQSIGGSADLQELHTQSLLVKVLDKAGATARNGGWKGDV